MLAWDAPETMQIVTRHEPDVSRSELITTRPADTGIRKAKTPAAKRSVRPPNISGYTWRKDGAGWELRKSVYDVSDTGIRKRRLPYVPHLAKSDFGELKRKHRGAALERAIAEWIEQRDR